MIETNSYQLTVVKLIKVYNLKPEKAVEIIKKSGCLAQEAVREFQAEQKEESEYLAQWVWQVFSNKVFSKPLNFYLTAFHSGPRLFAAPHIDSLDSSLLLDINYAREYYICTVTLMCCRVSKLSTFTVAETSAPKYRVWDQKEAGQITFCWHPFFFRSSSTPFCRDQPPTSDRRQHWSLRSLSSGPL